MVEEIEFAPEERRGYYQGVHYYVIPWERPARRAYIGFAARKGMKERKVSEIPIYTTHGLSHETLHMVLNEMGELKASYGLDKPSITPIAMIPFESGIAPQKLYHQSKQYRKLVRRLKK